MNGSLPIGRLFGIPLRLHWSAPLLVALLAFGLGSQTLPVMAPGHSRTAYVVAALIGALLLLFSLLLHESAHAVVARAKGVRVEDMTLWALGGVTRMGQPGSPGAVLQISGSGPLTSLLLGGIGIGAAFGAEEEPHWPVVAAVLLWTGSANVLLGAFNLLPAAPLDGGRVLQAVLWRYGGDRERADRAAARSGQVVGVALLALGAGAFVRGSPYGLWMMVIGFFITGSAGAEARQATLSGALRGVPVSEAMSSPVDTAPDWVSVARFISDIAPTTHHPTVPLVDLDGRPTGLITVRRLGMIPAGQREELRVREVAVPVSRCPTAAPQDDLYEALSRITTQSATSILVMEGSRLVGIVTPRDVARIAERHQARRHDDRDDGRHPKERDAGASRDRPDPAPGTGPGPDTVR